MQKKSLEEKSEQKKRNENSTHAINLSIVSISMIAFVIVFPWHWGCLMDSIKTIDRFCHFHFSELLSNLTFKVI